MEQVVDDDIRMHSFIEDISTRSIENLYKSMIDISNLCSSTIYLGCLGSTHCQISILALKQLIIKFRKISSKQIHIFFYEVQVPDLSLFSSLILTEISLRNIADLTFSISLGEHNSNIIPKESVHLICSSTTLSCFGAHYNSNLQKNSKDTYTHELKEMLIHRYLELVPGGRVFFLSYFSDTNSREVLNSIVNSGCERLISSGKMKSEEASEFLLRENKRTLNDCYDALGSIAQYFYVVEFEIKKYKIYEHDQHVERQNTQGIRSWVKELLEEAFLASLSLETDKETTLQLFISEIESLIVLATDDLEFSYAQVTIEKI